MSASTAAGMARVARLTLGFVWVYQGIVPKWIRQLPFELEIVHRSGLYLMTPEWMLAAVGVIETALGVWLLSGVRPRPAVLLATGCMLVLQTIVLVVEPSLLLGPFGGIVKNAGLIALGWMVWNAGDGPERGTGRGRLPGFLTSRAKTAQSADGVGVSRDFVARYEARSHRALLRGASLTPGFGVRDAG